MPRVPRHARLLRHRSPGVSASWQTDQSPSPLARRAIATLTDEYKSLCASSQPGPMHPGGLSLLGLRCATKLRRTLGARPLAPWGAAGASGVLPPEVRIRLVGQDAPGDGCRPRRQLGRVLEQVAGGQRHDFPVVGSERLDCRAKDELFEAGPANCRRAHGAWLRVGVQGEVGPGVEGLVAGQLVRAVGICEDGGAVFDCGRFS